MIPIPMRVSSSGEALIRQFEGDKLKAYKDSEGIWTDGTGNTHDVKPGEVITQAQDNADLERNIAGSEADVNHFLDFQPTQAEFDALVDFAFNCGDGAFEHSQLLKDVNTKQFTKVPADFKRWCHNSHGQVLIGLLRRREAEAKLFNPPS